MGYKVVILDSAQNEYESIVSYLAGSLSNKTAAQNFMSEFRRQLDFITDQPFLRTLSHIPELAARGYRKTPVNKYVMLYRVKGQTVYVAHVFHQTQDYARLV